MDKTSKRLLYALKNAAGKNGVDCVFFHRKEETNCYYNIAEQAGINEHECTGSINYLRKIGFLAPACLNGKTGKIEYGLCLTHEAIHYREFEWIKIKKYVAEKWIDFLALIVSVLSLVISVIAIILSAVSPMK